MALAFGMDRIVIDRERPTDPEASVYLSNTAITRGKPALTIESGGMGEIDNESIARIERGIAGLLKHLKMQAQGPDPVNNPVMFERSEVLRSGFTGILPAGRKGADREAGHDHRPRNRFPRESVGGDQGAVRRRSALCRRHPGDEQGRAGGLHRLDDQVETLLDSVHDVPQLGGNRVAVVAVPASLLEEAWNVPVMAVPVEARLQSSHALRANRRAPVPQARLDDRVRQA